MTPRADLGSRIGAWLLADYGLTIDSLEPIVGGLDPEAAVWLAVDDLGRSWAVKWTRRDTRFGLLLAGALAQSAVVGVPEQLTSRQGHPWSDRRRGRLSVSAWVLGREAFETGLAPAEWEALGRLLRRVHEEPPPPVDAVGDGPAVRRGIRRAGARSTARLRRIDRLAAAAGTGEDDDPVVARLLRAWPGIRARIVALREEAGRLRRTRTPTARVSCHGDPHLGNVLVDDAGQPWLIDFDDAVTAPREVDLMLVELGVLFTMPVTDTDRRAFHSGYGAVVLDQDRILRFGSVRAVEDLLQAVEDLLTGHPSHLPVDLETLIDGVLSEEGLAGRVEARLDRI
ncbi:phosphotransferase enzyme family protein [Frondihabitans cladoniiphilus]|uniref:Aminoglycoside phosphotransferase domain-containing protein n=1 Tax=Frondihabitans cladoniiphilus TaxID=715785 RepID=A0ABP8W326_9MICO